MMGSRLFLALMILIFLPVNVQAELRVYNWSTDEEPRQEASASVPPFDDTLSLDQDDAQPLSVQEFQATPVIAGENTIVNDPVLDGLNSNPHIDIQREIYAAPLMPLSDPRPVSAPIKTQPTKSIGKPLWALEAESLENEFPVFEVSSLGTDVHSLQDYKASNLSLLARQEKVIRLRPLTPEKAVSTVQDAPLLEPVNVDPDNPPVNFSADNLVNDEINQIVRASGNVEIKQAGRFLRADEVEYFLATDRVVAKGQVRLIDENGDVHRASAIEVEDQMKNGYVRELLSVLTDGSRFSSQEGERVDGNKTIMKNASYTPCEVCENSEDEPLWAISAGRVIHDKEHATVSYNHATFDVWGVPILYTPYFSHPDGSVDRKSGFISPSFGFDSDLGTFFGTNYYWNIAPDLDATIGLTGYTKENPLLTGEVRKRWDHASVIMNGSITKSERPDVISGVTVSEDDEVRGYLEGSGVWDINQKLRAGFELDYVSDDQYLRQYDISGEDVLTNELYLERFSGRDYAAARLLAFKDVRVRDEQVDQPNVLPEIVANFKGEPNSVPILGGRWEVEGTVLGLQRSGASEQDVNRISLSAGWNRRMVSDFGLVMTADANVRQDVYNTRDRALATPGSGRSTETTESRFFPQAHFEVSYPMARDFERMQMTIEPIVSLTAAPNINLSDDVPNEDSQDVQIDASNLFEPSRFPGVDRVEDQSRITYGFRSGLYAHNGNHADIFIGQSHRFEDDDNPFPEGSGLNNQNSDVVGALSLHRRNGIRADYRFQLDSRHLTSQRHELDIDAEYGRATFDANYLFAKGLDGTDIDDSREQIKAALGYQWTEHWRTRLSGTQDLGAQPGLREAAIALDYFGQCISWSLTGERNLTDDVSGDSSTEILFRVGLRNLGGYEASQFPEPRSQSATCLNL